MVRFINPQSTLGRSTRTDWLIMGVVAVVFILVTLVSTPENALAVSATIGVFATVIQIKWNSRRDPRMWVVIGVVAVAQLPALFLVHIPRLSFGLICLPPALIEGFALWGLLNWIERRSPRSGDAASSAGSVLEVGNVSPLDGIARGERAVDGGRVASHEQTRSRMARLLS